MYCIYRHYAKNGDLLYVGLSANVIARQKSHKSSPWFGDVDTVKFEMLEVSKKEALEVERNVICKEKPKFNKNKRWNDESAKKLSKKFRPTEIKAEAARAAYWAAIEKRKNQIRVLRKMKYSWTHIGKVFGISRQRAQQLGKEK